MSNAWRYECPKGHVAIQEKRGNNIQKPSNRFHCQTCNEGYRRVWDKKEKTWVTER